MNMKRTAAIVLAILLSVSFAAAETGTDWLTADDISRETMTAYAEYSALQRLNAKMMAGTLYHVAAEDDTLIDWMFALPNNFDSGKTYDIVVTALHGDSINNYDQQIRCTQGQMYDALRALNQNGGSYILLSPVIPRPGDIYPVGFDRRIFFSRDRYEEIYLDPDRQLLGAYALLQAWLVDHNVKVRAGLFIEGFSAGGMFAQRFTVLHPDVVRGCAAGQMGGLVTMPVEKVDGATLTWPEGISDYEEMMGYPFDLEAYQAIPQLLYIGSGDMKSNCFRAMIFGCGSMCMMGILSQSQRVMIFPAYRRFF